MHNFLKINKNQSSSKLQKEKNIINYKFLLPILFLSLVLGYYIGSKNILSNFINRVRAANTEKVYISEKKIKVDSDLFNEVQKNLNEKFVSWKATYTPPTEKEIEYNIIKGYVESFKDPYTEYFPPDDAKSFKENVTGSFGGVGMEVGMKDGVVTVISPLKDSPAMKAGIKSGDMILKVDGKDVYGMSSEEAVNLIRGEIGTDVIINILSKDSKVAKDIKITRDSIKVPTIDTKNINGIFVISLYSFTAESPELFKNALIEFSESGTNKLIIDLRGNPGGYLESAVEISSFFLPEGKVIVSEKSIGGDNIHEWRSKGYNVFGDKLKLYVLIDDGSASASEILAGALQDHGAAKIYGQKSYGKGSVQEFIDLKNGGSLKVTVAKWFTPNGRNITEDKIVPDVEVKRVVTTTYDSELKNIISLINKIK